jgi:hypothetical protein
VQDIELHGIGQVVGQLDAVAAGRQIIALERRSVLLHRADGRVRAAGLIVHVDDRRRVGVDVVGRAVNTLGRKQPGQVAVDLARPRSEPCGATLTAGRQVSGNAMTAEAHDLAVTSGLTANGLELKKNGGGDFFGR